MQWNIEQMKVKRNLFSVPRSSVHSDFNHPGNLLLDISQIDLSRTKTGLIKTDVLVKSLVKDDCEKSTFQKNTLSNPPK